MKDGSLLILDHNLFGASPTGKIAKGPPLPVPGMRIRPAGGSAAYIFGGASEPANHSVYLLGPDGSFVKLLTAPVPVTSVTGDGTTTYVAAGDTILALRPGAKVEAVMVAESKVISLERAPVEGFFFSTASRIGYWSKHGTYEFMRGRGGILRLRNSALYLLIPEGPYLLRFEHVERFGHITPAR
jgi:hypothetical protein